MTDFLPWFSPSADLSNWSIDRPEPDNDLHRHGPRWDVLNDSRTMFTLRGLVNLGCLTLLLLSIVTLLYIFFARFLYQWLVSDVGDVAP